MDTNLNELNIFINELRSTTKTTEKLEIIKAHMTDNYYLQEVISTILNPLKMFHVTSKTVLKQANLFSHKEHKTLLSLLNALTEGVHTGHDAIGAVNSFIEKNEEYKELILNCLDKDLKCRTGVSLFNKVTPGLIPEFNVALCSKYSDRKDKVDFDKQTFFASRKCDGVRVIAIVDEEGDARFFSREGLEYTALGKVAEDIKKLGFKDVVLDGEGCIVDIDGNESFRDMIKLVKKQDFTIPNPMYQIFDILSPREFQTKKGPLPFTSRLSYLKSFFKTSDYKSDYLRVLPQTKITSKEHFDELYKEAVSKNWEGLVIREDVGYEGKRTNHMLKVKEMSDAEYIVDGVEVGPFQHVENGKQIVSDVVTNIYITHKGTKVSVGSGFSLAERFEFMKHPEKIVGKKITVQYFEETTNDNGTVSLRFPIYKGVRDYE